MAEGGEIFIGAKPFMNYVTAAIIQLQSGTKEIVIKARGRWIKKAVDVAEYLRNKVMPDLKIKTIDIGSETVKGKNREGKEVEKRVSTITIILAKE